MWRSKASGAATSLPVCLCFLSHAMHVPSLVTFSDHGIFIHITLILTHPSTHPLSVPVDPPLVGRITCH